LAGVRSGNGPDGGACCVRGGRHFYSACIFAKEKDQKRQNRNTVERKLADRVTGVLSQSRRGNPHHDTANHRKNSGYFKGFVILPTRHRQIRNQESYMSSWRRKELA
jgi:hypothetical protein